MCGGGGIGHNPDLHSKMDLTYSIALDRTTFFFSLKENFLLIYPLIIFVFPFEFIIMHSVGHIFELERFLVAQYLLHKFLFKIYPTTLTGTLKCLLAKA